MEDDERDEEVRRLGLIDAVLAGIARHHEVADVVLASRSLPEAETGLMELLDFPDVGMARAVLDTQTRRLTMDERERLAAQAEELRGELDT